MEVKDAISRLMSTDKGSYNRGEVKQILDSITPDKMLASVPSLKVGDVFYYRVVGGKSRPWAALWVRRGLVGAATITHSENLPMSHKSQCRFYLDSYIGPTITVIDQERVLDAVTIPYSNKKHLKEVKESIKSLWS